MNRMSVAERARIVAALVGGNSIRATCRMTGTAKGTVTRLLAEVGAACAAYQDEHLRGLTCRRVECNEIWSFCHSKEKNVPEEHRGEFGYGDVWTWVAIGAETKLVPTRLLGRRIAADAQDFIEDLALRLTHRVQLTTDGLRLYLDAVEGAFGAEIDYAQLIKVYGKDPAAEKRYSLAKCLGIEIKVVEGDPDEERISTSYIERQNLTMRMGMRRFTRLTNGFSKKVENLGHAVALHFVHYNFCRKHQTLKTTPAIAAGVEDHIWSVEEIVALTELSAPARHSN